MLKSTFNAAYRCVLLCVLACPVFPQNVVKVYGNWPPDNFCVRQFAASATHQIIDAPCNEEISAVEVPFGMSVDVCEHDGRGSSGRGKCRRFLPGTYFVGSDFNNIGTSFLVENKMIGYLNSADLPTSWRVRLKRHTEGPLKPGMIITSDWNGMNMDYDIPLPSSCAHPNLVETTKANSAKWNGRVENGRLKLHLHVDFRGLFGADNWVGVEIKCRP
jgi:hypothetical protein